MEEWLIKTVLEFIKGHRYVWLALYFVVFIVAFFIIEANTPTEGYWVTDLPVDEYIPFVPQAIWAYILWYPLFAAVGLPLMILDGDAFKRWMYYMMLTLTAALVFGVLIPNGQHLRPQGMEVTGVSTWILSLLWKADTCTNVFPSMHVLGCIGDIAGVLDSKIFGRKWAAVIVVGSILCAASTVLVKQHAIIDTAGAFLFSLPALMIVYGSHAIKRHKERLQ